MEALIGKAKRITQARKKENGIVVCVDCKQKEYKIFASYNLQAGGQLCENCYNRRNKQ
jgi:hypothetical protein